MTDDEVLKIWNETPATWSAPTEFARRLRAAWLAELKPVATFVSRRVTPEDTAEFYGYLSDFGAIKLQTGDKLYALPDAAPSGGQPVVCFGTVPAMINSQPLAAGERSEAADLWTMCCFIGPPPDEYPSWYAFCEAKVKRGVTITRTAAAQAGIQTVQHSDGTASAAAPEPAPRDAFQRGMTVQAKIDGDLCKDGYQSYHKQGDVISANACANMAELIALARTAEICAEHPLDEDDIAEILKPYPQPASTPRTDEHFLACKLEMLIDGVMEPLSTKERKEIWLAASTLLRDLAAANAEIAAMKNKHAWIAACQVTISALQVELAELRAEREGMVMVPKEPTNEMVNAGYDVLDVSGVLTDAYKAMLAASRQEHR